MLGDVSWLELILDEDGLIAARQNRKCFFLFF
jgi:hypothetical protein